MQKFRALFDGLKPMGAKSNSWIVFTLVFTLLGTFGFLAPSLGFYQDDWHPIFYGYVRGLGSLSELFLFDGRPFAALIYQAAFPVIGYQPLHWQLLALSLRTLTVLFTWLALREIWPARSRETGSAALLFAVYPLFSLQPLSVIYTIHWTGFLLFSVSLWAMLRSLRPGNIAFPLALVALLTCGSHLLLLEYFAGLELARPVLIYLAKRDERASFYLRLRQVFAIWWPYLILFLAFVVYRLFFLPTPNGSVGNEPLLVQAFFQSPFQTAFHFIQLALQDITAILFSAWHSPISPGIFNLGSPLDRVVLLLIIASAIVLYLLLTFLPDGQVAQERSSTSWPRQALLAGLVLTALGPFPAWVTDQSITNDNPLWSSRFGLASMAGAALVLVALVEGLVASRSARSAILSILIAASIGWHFQYTNDYRRSWIEQRDFFWQLSWRAPYIAPGTAILSAGEVLPYMGEYPTSFALSTLYPESVQPGGLNYYFFNLEKHFATGVEDLIGGIPLSKTAYSSRFTGYSHESLVIHYEPENYECLWVLRPQDQEVRALPEITREVLSISNLNRIQVAAKQDSSIPVQVFGPEPEHTWCYHFQKADLARQSGEWDRVAALWEAASSAGFTPGNGVEYLPFIEGFAHLGRWETAADLTLAAETLPRVMGPSLCATWDRLERETPPSTSRQAALDQVRGLLCSPAGD
jgi:hypothetical protein